MYLINKFTFFYKIYSVREYEIKKLQTLQIDVIYTKSASFFISARAVTTAVVLSDDFISYNASCMKCQIWQQYGLYSNPNTKCSL